MGYLTQRRKERKEIQEFLGVLGGLACASRTWRLGVHTSGMGYLTQRRKERKEIQEFLGVLGGLACASFYFR